MQPAVFVAQSLLNLDRAHKRGLLRHVPTDSIGGLTHIPPQVGCGGIDYVGAVGPGGALMHGGALVRHNTLPSFRRQRPHFRPHPSVSGHNFGAWGEFNVGADGSDFTEGNVPHGTSPQANPGTDFSNPDPNSGDTSVLPFMDPGTLTPAVQAALQAVENIGTQAAAQDTPFISPGSHPGTNPGTSPSIVGPSTPSVVKKSNTMKYLEYGAIGLGAAALVFHKKLGF